MNKKYLIIAGLGLALIGPTQSRDLELLEGDFTVGYDGEISTSGSSENISFQNSYISLNAEYKNKLRMVLTAKLEEAFKENSVEFNRDFDIEEFIQEAYIEIKEVAGSPVAIIVGKKAIPFSQKVQATPLFHNNPLASLQNIDEVIGVTVDLREGIFGIFDQVELSVFETEKGDLNIGNVNGAAVRLTKILTDNILLTMGHAELGDNDFDGDVTRRSTVGLIAESNDGKLVGWVEGMYFSNDPTYPDSKFGITIGGMINVHRTTDVIVEFNYVQNVLNQYVLASRTALTANTTLGLEVRYNDYKDGRDNDIVFGINVTYTFNSSGYNQNQDYLFDGEDQFFD